MNAPIHLLHVFPTFAVGGAQMRMARLANHFGSGFRHAIVAMDGVRDCAARLDPSLDVKFPDITVRKGRLLANVLGFRRALLAIRPDLLVTHNWGTIEWAMANRLVGLRHLHVEDGFGPEERTHQIPRRVLIRRAVLRRCTTVLPSRTLLRIATDLWRLPADRLRYVPNGIDLTRFAPRGRSGPVGAAPVIGTVATLRAEKNLPRLLRAFQALIQQRPARLVIVGDGPERAALEALAAGLGVAEQIRFTGSIGDPAAIYAEFDVFALTSDTEQMPMSVLEAMASGLPLVATDVGDVRDMLAAENAPFLTPCADAAVVSALRALLDADGAARLAIGAANRAKAERDYGQDRMISAWRGLYAGSDAVNAVDPEPPAA